MDMMNGYNWWGGMPYMGMGYMIFGFLFWSLLIIGIVYLIVWLIRKSNTPTSQTHSALDILKERYAKGEIDKQEYEEKKKDLIA